MKNKSTLIVFSIIVILLFISFAVYSIFQKSANSELHKIESEEEQKLASEIKLTSGKIKEEDIYIVEDKLNILKSKKDAEVYIEKAFSYLLQDRYKFHDILIKKEGYSVQLFTRNDGEKDIVYLNFFILDYKADYFNTKQVVVWDGGTDFWNITYDIQKDEFYDIWINGE
jgi:hypothetical protein